MIIYIYAFYTFRYIPMYTQMMGSYKKQGEYVKEWKSPE